MNIPIEVPLYGALILFVIMFACMNYQAKNKIDKIGSIVALILWCFVVGFITYADLFTKSN